MPPQPVCSTFHSDSACPAHDATQRQPPSVETEHRDAMTFCHNARGFTLDEGHPLEEDGQYQEGYRKTSTRMQQEISIQGRDEVMEDQQEIEKRSTVNESKRNRTAVEEQQEDTQQCQEEANQERQKDTHAMSYHGNETSLLIVPTSPPLPEPPPHYSMPFHSFYSHPIIFSMQD